jgi:hypothetical protein
MEKELEVVFSRFNYTNHYLGLRQKEYLAYLEQRAAEPASVPIDPNTFYNPYTKIVEDMKILEESHPKMVQLIASVQLPDKLFEVMQNVADLIAERRLQYLKIEALVQVLKPRVGQQDSSQEITWEYALKIAGLVLVGLLVIVILVKLLRVFFARASTGLAPESVPQGVPPPMVGGMKEEMIDYLVEEE